MRYSFVLALIIVSACSSVDRIIASPIGDGHIVGNGGDAVFCTKSTENKYDGIYVLDEILANQNAIIKILNSDDFLRKLIVKLKTSNYLGYELESFYNSFVSKDDYNLSYFNLKWTPNDGALVDINDSNMNYRTLAKNCNFIKQAVIRFANRKETPWTIEYLYHNNTINKLIRDNKVDWLLIHEFLWNYYGDANLIREVNFFLHNKKILEMTSEEINSVFDRLSYSSSLDLNYYNKGIKKISIEVDFESNYSEGWNIVYLKTRNKRVLVNAKTGEYFSGGDITKMWQGVFVIDESLNPKEVKFIITNDGKFWAYENGKIKEIDSKNTNVSTIDSISTNGANGVFVRFKDGNVKILFDYKFLDDFLTPVNDNIVDEINNYNLGVVKNTHGKIGLFRLDSSMGKISSIVETVFDRLTKKEVVFEDGRKAYDLIFTNDKNTIYIRLEGGLYYRTKIQNNLSILDSKLYPVVVFANQNNLNGILNVQTRAELLSFSAVKILSRNFYFEIQDAHGNKGAFVPNTQNSVQCFIDTKFNAEVSKDSGVLKAKLSNEKNFTSETFNNICKKV